MATKAGLDPSEAALVDDILQADVAEEFGDDDERHGHIVLSVQAQPQRTIAFWFRAKELDKGDGKKKPVRQVLYEEGGSGSGLNL